MQNAELWQRNGSAVGAAFRVRNSGTDKPEVKRRGRKGGILRKSPLTTKPFRIEGYISGKGLARRNGIDICSIYSLSEVFVLKPSPAESVEVYFPHSPFKFQFTIPAERTRNVRPYRYTVPPP